MNFQDNLLLERAQKEYDLGNEKNLQLLLKKAVEQEIDDPRLWKLLHRVVNSKLPVNDFRDNFVKRYYKKTITQKTATQSQDQFSPETERLFPPCELISPPIFPFPLEAIFTDRRGSLKRIGGKSFWITYSHKFNDDQICGQFIEGDNNVIGTVQGPVVYENAGCLTSLFFKPIQSVEMSLYDQNNGLFGYAYCDKSERIPILMDISKTPVAKFKDSPYGTYTRMEKFPDYGMIAQITRTLTEQNRSVNCQVDQFGNIGQLPIELQKLLFFGFIVQMAFYGSMQSI